MGGRVSGVLLHATTRAGAGIPTAPAEGCERSYRRIRSRWCMLGNEDEPSGPDAWAARSRRARTPRAYAQKLAKTPGTVGHGDNGLQVSGTVHDFAV